MSSLRAGCEICAMSSIASCTDALSSSRNDSSPTNICLNEQPLLFAAIDQSQLVYHFLESWTLTPGWSLWTKWWKPAKTSELRSKCASQESHRTICLKEVWCVCQSVDWVWQIQRWLQRARFIAWVEFGDPFGVWIRVWVWLYCGCVSVFLRLAVRSGLWWRRCAVRAICLAY